MPGLNRRVRIANALGFHLRAAAQFVRLAQQFRADVRVHLDGKGANGKSILDLTTLAAARGIWLDLEARGPDAEESNAALCELIESRFHEKNEGSGV
jgi:phosphocarrier protein HPr